LIDYGEAQRDTTVTIDYFAVSLPDFLVFEDDMQARHRRHCRYMMGLGYLGLDQPEQAAACFDAVLADDPAHLGAVVHRRLLREG
jgi:Tfp pilus assembly protein PilF